MKFNQRDRTDPALAEPAFSELEKRLESILVADDNSEKVGVKLDPLSLQNEKRFGAEWDTSDKYEALFVRVRYTVSVSDVGSKEDQNLSWYAVGLRCLHWLTPQSISGNKKGEFEVPPKSGADEPVRVSVGEVSVEPFQNQSETTSSPRQPCCWIVNVPLAIYLPRKQPPAKEIGIIDVQINGPDERVTVSAFDFKDEIGNSETDVSKKQLDS